MVAGEVVLSWAGEAARFVSNPLFLFLTLRWIWRFLVWTALLYRISRLPLQLTPLHPDRSAGLGFLAIYPSIFSGFVFALSCVIASNFLKELALVRHSPETVWFALAGWLAMILVLFLGPLLVFARPALRGARAGAARVRPPCQSASSRLPSQVDRGGEKRRGAHGLSRSLLGIGSERERASRAELRVVPIDRAVVVQLVVAAGIPLLAVVATQVPLADLAKWILGTIL